MAIYEFEGKRPQIGKTSFVAETADVIGEGAVVKGEVPYGKIAVGIPAKIIGDVTEKHKAEWEYYKKKYTELASARYPKGLKRIG